MIKKFSRLISFILSFNLIFTSLVNVFSKSIMVEALTEETYSINLALNKKVNVSGVEVESFKGELAVDGDYISEDSRWSSAEVTDSNPQWLVVDLGKEYVLEKVNIYWQNWAYGTEYKLQKSADGNEWTDLMKGTNPLGKDEINKNLINKIEINKEKSRFIKVLILKRNQWKSVSIRELEVIGYELKEGNIALNKKATASAIENNSNVWTADKMVDGDIINDDSRWASPSINVVPTPQDEHWALIDFVKEVEIDSVKINWYKKAFAENYIIQLSDDGKVFRDVKTITHNSSDEMNKVDNIKLDKMEKARCLRIYIKKRNANAYNNVSIREIEVMGREKYVPELDLTSSQVINSITSLEKIDISDTKIKLPKIPNNFGIKVRGSEFENVISNNGEISKSNINDRKVSIILEVYKINDETDTATKSFVVSVPGKSSLKPDIFEEVSNGNKEPKVIPSLQEWYGLNGNFKLTESSRILINDSSNTDLNKVATLFNKDLKDFTGMNLEVIKVKSDNEVKSGDIYIESMNDDIYDLGDEGNFITIKDSIKIYAKSYTGSLYGTVTLLQILWQSQGKNEIPCGVIRDYPKYEIRGAMLDVARIPMRMEFLEDYSKILSWYKLNEFHIHLNDNQWAIAGTNYNDPNSWNDVYSAFRLESKNHPGLKPSNDDLNDPYYTQEEFIELQKMAMDYGMEVVPEIDTPAHSLPFTKYMKEIGEPIHSTKYWFDHIDIDNQKGKAFIKEIIDEFTNESNPVFLGETIHLGIDEYDTSVGDKFRQYAADLSNYVLQKGKTPRVWGSLKPYNGPTMLPKGTIIDIWNTGWDDPIARIKEGYSVVNVPQPYTYITPSRWHKDFMDTQNIYENWEPNIFNSNLILPLGEPQLLGGKMALWGDESMEGMIEMDLHQRLLPAVATLAEKTWAGTKEDKNYLEFMKTFNILEEGPNTTVDREIESKGELLVEYNFEKGDASDSSANGYNGVINSGQIITQDVSNKTLRFNGDTVLGTPLRAVSYPYTASFDVKINDFKNEVNLFSGYEGELKVKEDGTLALRRSFYEQDFNYKFKENTWTNVTIVGTFQAISLYIDGEFIQQLHSYRRDDNTIISGQEYYTTFVLPLEKIGEKLNGEMDNIKIYNTVMSDKWISGDKDDRINLACGSDAYSSSNNRLYTKEWRAVDGDLRSGDSRWISKNTDNEWLMIDLKEIKNISEIKLLFGTAPKEYKILTSLDGYTFNEIADVKDNNKLESSITFEEKDVRYIKFQGIKRGSNSNYSIIELQAFGKKIEAVKNPDLNNDGVVNLGDLAIISRYYGKNKPEYDFNNDGIIDDFDITFISNIILGTNQ